MKKILIALIALVVSAPAPAQVVALTRFLGNSASSDLFLAEVKAVRTFLDRRFIVMSVGLDLTTNQWRTSVVLMNAALVPQATVTLNNFYGEKMDFNVDRQLVVAGQYGQNRMLGVYRIPLYPILGAAPTSYEALENDVVVDDLKVDTEQWAMIAGRQTIDGVTRPFYYRSSPTILGGWLDKNTPAIVGRTFAVTPYGSNPAIAYTEAASTIQIPTLRFYNAPRRLYSGTGTAELLGVQPLGNRNLYIGWQSLNSGQDFMGFMGIGSHREPNAPNNVTPRRAAMTGNRTTVAFALTDRAQLVRSDLVLRRFTTNYLPDATGVIQATFNETLMPTSATLDSTTAFPLPKTLGEVYVSASSQQPNNLENFYVAKFSSTAVPRWAFRLPATTYGNARAQSVAVDPETGDVLAGGYLRHPTQVTQGLLVVFRQAPVALADNYTIAKNRPYSNNFMANDRFAYGLLPTIVTPPARGSALIQTDGRFTYTPNTNFVGTDRIIYRLSKPGTTPSTATVTFTVR